MARTLKALREDAYMSLRDLAKKSGVTVRTIWRIENQEYERLRPSTMRKISEALGVHPSEVTEFTREQAEEE